MKNEEEDERLKARSILQMSTWPRHRGISTKSSERIPKHDEVVILIHHEIERAANQPEHK